MAYHLKQKLWNGEQAIEVTDDKDIAVATVRQTMIEGNEKRNSFEFEINGEQATLGIKCGRILFANYRFHWGGEEFLLKDHPANSILHFCVTGKMHGRQVELTETWSKGIDVKFDGRKIAAVKTSSSVLGASIMLEEAGGDPFLPLALSILGYFMYKIYSDESDVIENILEEML